MKLELEINGVMLKIEELEGNIVVKAEKDGETMDEMTVSTTDEPTEDDDAPMSDEPMGDEPTGDDLPIDDEQIEEAIKTFADFFAKK